MIVLFRLTLRKLMECFIVQVTPSPTVLWMGIHPSYFIHESNCLLTKKIFSVFFIHGYKSKASNIKVVFFFLNDIDIDKEYICGGEQSNNSLKKYQLL